MTKHISHILYGMAIFMLAMAPFQYLHFNAAQAVSGYCELTLTKTDDVDPVSPGDNIVYTLRLENTGTANCTGGGVRLRDVFDSRTTPVTSDRESKIDKKKSDYWQWNFGTMSPGEVEIVNFTVKVDSDVPCETTLLNKAKYWSDQTDWGSYVEETTMTTDCSNPFCGDGIVNQSSEQCDDGNQNNNDSCGTDCLRKLKDIPVNTCTGDGTLLLYQDDQFQDMDVYFTAVSNEVLVFVKSSLTPNVEVNSAGYTPNLVAEETSPFRVKVYSIATNPGDNVYVYGSGDAMDIQGYLMQNSASPVYDISTMNVIYDDEQSNDMYLTAGTYTYLFLDKYNFYSNGNVDTRNLTVNIDGPSGNLLNDSYTDPYPAPSEGVVVKNYTVTEAGTYSLSLDTKDSIYWFLNDCPVEPICGDGVVNQPSEECDGTDGVGPHQECSDQCTLVDLTYCGDDTRQQPNDEGTGGPNNDGYEDCDGTDGVGNHQDCTNDCTLEDLTYCGDNIVQSPNDEGTGGPNNDGYEECDGSTGVGPHQECSSECALVDLTYCGDHIVQTPNDEGTGGPNNDGYEECDTDMLLGQYSYCEQCTIKYVPHCGDGNLDPGEACDDGNNVDGDGCSAVCQLELGDISGCKYKDLDNNGVIDSGEPTIAQWTIYLDNGQTQTSMQTAVSGCYTFTDLPFGTYTVSEDQVPGWTQTYPVNPATHTVVIDSIGETSDQDFANYQEPIVICGDGVVNQPSEECDGTDGVGPHQECSDQCTLVDLTYCGDDTRQQPNDEGTGGPNNDGYEECDGTDGVGANQSCSASCELIDLAYCGDGNLDSGEDCDDGNNVDGDGCSAVCTLEEDEPFCGNGILDPGEACDGTAGSYPSNYICTDQCTTQCSFNCGGGGPVNPFINIEKSAEVSFTNRDTVVEYTISVTNTGNKEGYDLTVVDVLPTGLEYTGTTTYGTTTATTTGTWDLGNIAIGETKTFSYDVYFGPDLAEGDYTNTATASITNGNSDTDDAVVEVRVPTVYSEEYAPILAIDKVVNMEFTNPGGEITYTVTITNTNTGDLTALNVNLLDRLPKEFQFLEDETQVKTWYLGDLAPQESVSVSYDVKVKGDTPQGIYDNIAVARADNAPEVSDLEPIEVRDVTVFGFELPDTNGGSNALLSLVLGVLLLLAGSLFSRLKRQAVQL